MTYKKEFINALNYDDVFIIPQYSDISSRKEVSVSSNLYKDNNIVNIKVPIMNANMDTTAGKNISVAIANSGGLATLHRFQSIEDACNEYVDAVKELHDKKTPIFVSIGVNRDSQERAQALYNVGARYFIIDIAHGHSKQMKDMINWMKQSYSDCYIMAGNVATKEAVVDLANWGADAIKLGIGPGCFAAGTRILMSNGTYKNIEDVKPGDRIINMEGKSKTVKNAFSTGIKKVIKYKTNIGIENTICTEDHLHWIGDISTNNRIDYTGYARVLDKMSKTSPRQSKYKWKEINYCSKENAVLLMPKTINFDLEKDFNITLKKCSGGNYKSGFRYENYVNLKPNYELGYIFGTFLGDGCSRTITNKKRRSNSVNWYFGKNELEIAIKLNECVEKIFGRSTNIRETKNTTVVTLHDKPFADFLSHFGKRDNKHLPEEFLVLNKFYLQGLFDGLIDSDGNISKNNRISLHNSSKKIIELFGVINYILQGYFPNVAIRNPTVGGLKNCNIENVKTTYNSRLLKRPDYRFTKNYQIVKILKKESLEQEVEVFDLEIDDDTHSFIANNSIVHNSVCLTKNVTGVTLPQFSCIQDCHAGKMIAENTTGRKITLIADGGIREIGDICKAIGQGADFVMSGKLFAGCIEAPGKGIYRGSASSDVQTKYRTDKEYVPTPEGTSIKVEQTNESVLQLIEHVAGGLRSAYSYSNARNTGEFQTKVLFGIRHNKT